MIKGNLSGPAPLTLITRAISHYKADPAAFIEQHQGLSLNEQTKTVEQENTVGNNDDKFDKLAQKVTELEQQLTSALSKIEHLEAVIQESK